MSSESELLDFTSSRERVRAGQGGWKARVTDVVRSPAFLIVGAALLYTVLAVRLTWPLAEDLDGTIFGAFGDLTGSIAGVRELVEGGHNPFAPGRLEDLGAPEGRPIDWPQNVAAFSSTIVLYLLTAAFGGVAAFGLFVLLGFALSGTAMFALVQRLTGNAGIALLIGWAYAFYPFVVIKAAGHVHFVHGWVLVLVLWRMLALYARPDVRNGIWCGLATVVAIGWSPYFLLVGGIEFGTLFCVGLVLAFVRDRARFRLHVRAQLTAAGIVVLFALALVGIASLSERGTGIAPRDLSALITYSARPLEYIVPPSGNTLVGDETGPWLAGRLHGSNFAENTLYVGISLLLLAAVGLIAVLRHRTSTRMTVAALAALPMGLVAAIWSAPPKVTILGHLVPFPSLITFEVSSAWRVYSRFVMVVMLAVCVLAAIGLARLLRGRPVVVQAVLLLAIAAVVVVDLRVAGIGTNRVATSPLYEQLEDLPDGLVASYPIEPSGHGDYSAEFSQQWHEKPLVNGYLQGSLEESRALQLDDLEDPRTPARLATLGVRYVVIEDVPIEAGVQDPGTPARGLRLLTEDGATTLWRVTAKPLPLLTTGSGFSPAEAGPDGVLFHWLAADEGELELRAACDPCNGVLRFRAHSFARPRELRLSDPEGRVVGRARIGTADRSVELPVRFARRAVYRVETRPGPEPIAEAIEGSQDPRSVSVAFLNLRLSVR
jgi:hypothetical protein